MKKERKNIMMITGSTLKICNNKLFVLASIVFIVLSCKSQNANCGYSLTYDSVSKKKVYSLVDKMPIYLNKEGDIGRYIARKYEDKTNVGIQITIKLGFIINKEGILIGARIINKKKDEYTDEEKRIIDIIKSSPKWAPGVCAGKTVDVMIQMRLRFVIDENGRLR